MSYTRNFGMRSFQNIVRSGRDRVPTDGPMRIGTAVVVDGGNPGFLARPAAAAAPDANSGIVLFEHIDAAGQDPALVTGSESMMDAPAGKYAQRIHGPGTKVWFRNTPAKTMYDGSTRAAETMVNGDLATLAPGGYLTPAADGTWDQAVGPATGWLQVTHVNPDTGLVEAEFTF